MRNSPTNYPLVGRTPVREIPELNEAFNVSKLLIKDESTNPTGTWKDRRSANILRRLNGHRKPHICLITTGNAAFSIAELTKDLNIRITAIVSNQINSEIADQMEKQGIRVISTKLNSQPFSGEIEKLAQQDRSDHPIDVTHSIHSAYASIIDELNPSEPDYIIAPFGSGEAIFGMSVENYRSQLFCPHHAAKIIGVKSREPISQADKLIGDISPYPKLLEEYAENGQINLAVSEQEISDAFKKISPYLQVEPSAAVAFAALSRLPIKPSDKVVVINSGCGIH